MLTYPEQPAKVLEEDPNHDQWYIWTIDLAEADEAGPTCEPFIIPPQPGRVHQTFFAGITPETFHVGFWDNNTETWYAPPYPDGFRMSADFAFDPAKYPPQAIPAPPAPTGWTISRYDYPAGWWTLLYPSGAVKPIGGYERTFPESKIELPRVGNRFYNPHGAGYWWYSGTIPPLPCFFWISGYQKNYYCSTPVKQPYPGIMPTLTALVLLGSMILMSAPISTTSASASAGRRPKNS